MFDVGFWELSLIAVVALLVVGPERLPGLARSVGRWVGKARRYADHLRREIERDVHATELREMLQKPAPLDDVYEALDDTKKDLAETRDALKNIEASASSSDGGSRDSEVETTRQAIASAGEAITATSRAPVEGSTDDRSSASDRGSDGQTRERS